MKILIVDDHQIIREGLHTLIDRQPDMEVVAEASDGREAINFVRQHEPQVVVMDISMADMNGIEATREIRTLFPEVKVIGLSMHTNKRFVAEMLKAGATGYLLKDCAFEELTTAIRSVQEGKMYLSPEIASGVIKDLLFQPTGENKSVFGILSPREREVLQLLAEGHSTKEIALRQHVSAKTVETQRQRIMDKLNIRSIAELTKYAIREGLTPLE